MMKRFIGTLMLMTAALSAYPVRGWGGVSMRALLPDLNALNSAITQVNRSEVGGSSSLEFSQPLLMLGAEGGFAISQVTFAFWGGGLSKRTSGDSLSAKLEYGMGYGEMGFQFEPRDWLWIRPSFEIGGAGFSLELNQLHGQGFGQLPEDTLEEPYRYWVNAGQVNVGAGLLVQFNIALTETGIIGFALKGGYLYPLYTSPWYDQDGWEVPTIEGFDLHGPYLGAEINFGGRGNVSHYGSDDDWGDDLWE